MIKGIIGMQKLFYHSRASIFCSLYCKVKRKNKKQNKTKQNKKHKFKITAIFGEIVIQLSVLTSFTFLRVAKEKSNVDMERKEYRQIIDFTCFYY